MLHLLQHHLYVKAEKYASTVSFMGFIIAEGAVSMYPEKVKDWLTPTSHTRAQRFLGFENFYGKFIRILFWLLFHSSL